MPHTADVKTAVRFLQTFVKVTTQKNEKTETHFCVSAMLFGGMGVLFQKASPEKFLSKTFQQFLQA
jgi:hypothetical protein